MPSKGSGHAKHGNALRVQLFFRQRCSIPDMATRASFEKDLKTRQHFRESFGLPQEQSVLFSLDHFVFLMCLFFKQAEYSSKKLLGLLALLLGARTLLGAPGIATRSKKLLLWLLSLLSERPHNMASRRTASFSGRKPEL